MSKLTRKMLDEAFEAVRNAPPHPCRLGEHVVSATAIRERWKYTRCGNCGAVVSLFTEAENPPTPE